MKIGWPVLLCILAAPGSAQGQEAQERCRFVCAPEFKLEPTLTVTNLFGPARVVGEAGVPVRERRETEFELILSLDLPTRISWLGFTMEAIVQPFDRESTPELELETNFTWLPPERTSGWVSAHFDLVDTFSPAERPTDRGAYTHKLNFEVDTAVSVFNWLAEGRWLRGVELETSLDYVATGTAKADDEIGGKRFLTDASRWSFSLVVAIPVAPW